MPEFADSQIDGVRGSSRLSDRQIGVAQGFSPAYRVFFVSSWFFVPSWSDDVEVRQLLELGEAVAHLIGSQAKQPIDAEVLDGK